MMALISIYSKINNILSKYIIHYEDNIIHICCFGKGDNEKPKKLINNMPNKPKPLNKRE